MGQTKYAKVVKAVDAIADALEFVKVIDEFLESNPDGPILISFGTFEMGGDARKPGAAKNSAPITSGEAQAPDETENEQANKVTKKIGTTSGSFRFPLLSDPMQAFGLLTGKDVTLFIYDLPKLQLEFEYIKSFPIFPGLNARFGGSVKAETNFSFGFDTSGINQWKAEEFALNKSYLVANGFFLDDHIEGGVDMPEVTLEATIIAGASLGIGGLVEAGAQGDITLSIAFDLNDNPGPGFSLIEGETRQDNKLRWAELVARVSDGPQCLFVMSGTLTAGLDAFLWIGLDTGFFKITLFNKTFSLFRATLFDFNLKCVGVTPPDLVRTNTVSTSNVVRNAGDPAGNDGPVYYDQVDNGVLILNMGPLAEGRGGEWTSDDNEKFLIGFDLAPDGVTEVTKVTFQGITEYYIGVTQVVGHGGQGNDEILVDKKVTADVTFHGGAGSDVMTQKGLGIARFFGDNGNDGSQVWVNYLTLVPQARQSALDKNHEGEDILIGGVANDYLVGGGHKDLIDGGPGDDTIYGDAGNDTLIGGDGNDLIYGGDEANQGYSISNNATSGTFRLRIPGADSSGDQVTENIPWNASQSVVATRLRSLTVDGQSLNVSVSGSGTESSPWVIESDGREFTLEAIDSELVDVPTFGLSREDGGVATTTVKAVAHGDGISGDGGNDEIYAGNGNDAVDGGEGDDWIEGGSGSDRLLGRAGNDVIVGDGGNDVVEGGLGIDVLVGGAGNDTFNWRGFNEDGDGNSLGSDGTDDFISGDAGRDGLNFTATSERDLIELETVTNANTTITKTKPVSTVGASKTFTRNSVVLSGSISGEVSEVITASDIELLAVNAGDGADRISVGSLQGSGVTNFSTDLGLSSGLISQTNEIQKRNSAGNLLYLTPEGSETTIQSGNEPLYQMVAARDSNGNARLYAGVVGGTVVDQIEQVSVLTPKGEVVKDDVWTITLTLDGISESYEYTVLAGDTMERIASELTQKITLESDYFTANLVDVITDEEDVKGIQLTLGTSGRPFRVSYDTVAGDGKSAAGGTFAVRETPFEAPLTNASITFDEDIDQNGSVDDDERLKSGEIWAVTLDGIDYEVTTETSDTVDEIRSKIRDKINEAFNDSHGDLRVDTPLGTPSYNAAVIGSELRISNWPQKTYNLMGAVTLGDVWNVVVDTETFTYTILEDDTLESVAFGLAQAIDSHDNYQGSQVGTSLVVVRSGTVPTFTAAVSRRFLIPETSTIEVPGLDANGDVMSDDDADEIIIFGDSLLDDQFEVESNESVVRVTRRIGTDYVLTYDILNAKRSNETADLDSLTIYADSSDPLDIMGGRDTVDASAVVYDLLALSLAGGAGNDRLIGSSFDDVLDSGLGNDDVTGGPGVDTFIDAGGVDTLIETRDWDMSLFGGHFVVGKIAGDSGGEFYKTNQAGFSDAAGIVNINPDTAGTAGDTDQVGIGDVTGVIISDGGSGYTSAATVTFSSAPTGGVTATGTLVIENGVITGVTLTNPGSGYVTPPTINFSKAGPFAIDFLGDPDPQMAGLRDTGDQYYPAGETFETSVAGIDKEIILEVEVIPQVEGKSIFENARITGGDSNNVIVVGDQDNRINVGGSIITTSGWTGRATLDNRVSRINGSSFSEYYIVNLDGNSGGSVVISDSGGTEGFDELYIFGTSDDDEFYLNRAGEDTGRVIAGERFDLTKPYNVEVTGSVKRDKVHLSISNRNPNLPVSLESTTPGTTVIPASNGQGFRFQFTGEVATGSPWNVSVDGIAYNYTARLSDTLYDVARGLQSLIRGVNPQRDTVLYRDVERMTIRTMDGDDSLLSDDTATTVVIEMGRGDDTMSVGSVPQIPDEGNKNLEYPDGVPVADTDNMTNGNSFEMFAFGAGGDDQFEVNHNIAALYLGGGDGDDTFIINTFIALKKNPDRPDDITNLTNLFGGRGSNRYEYVQNAPVFINGGYGTDTMVINGTPIDDQFVITEFYVAGAGRIVYFAGIERLEVNSAGGKDDIYVLSSPAEMEITVRGGSNDDIIYLGGDAPAQVFDPPAFKYQPPPFTVQDPAVMVEEVKIRPAQTIRSTYSWWDTVWGSRGNVSAWALIQAVTDLTTWYASQVAKDPSFRLISHSSINNVIEQMVLTHVEQISSRYWWQFWAPVVKVTYQLPEIRYGISKPVLPEPRVITPAVVEVDPVIFALKSTANYTVADIKGRLVVDGGNDSESDGDKVIVHNEDGTITTGSLTNETIAVKDGERIQAFDSSGDALFDAGVVVREPNQTTLTLSGSVVSGQVYTVKIDTDTNERNGFSLSLPAYTANVADGLDLDSVADELAAIIDNNANYSATTSGSKVIITGQTSADRITRLSATVAEPVNTSGTVTFVPGNSEWEVELSGTVKTGDYWGVNVNDGISSSPIAFDFWSKAGQNSLETVARFLARAIARYPTLNAVAVDRKITITAANPGPIISSVTLQNSAANGRIPIKNTDYRQRYNDNGNPVSRTYVSLQGLALPGGISVDGTSYQGVLIQNIENMDIRLGFDGSDDTKNDRFTFNLSGSETISQRTTLVMGGGDDIANVQAVSGETRILGGSGNDLINVLDAASALGTQFIEGDLNIRDDVQTVLYSELDPLFKEVVDNAPSVFQSEGSSVTKVPIVYRDGDEVWVNVAKLDSRGQIVEVNYQDEINESVGDVAVTRPSPKEWSILFPRSEAGLIEELVVGTQNLVGVSVSGNLTNRRIYQTGTGGTFTLTVNGKTTDAIPYDATAAEVQAALEKVVEGQTGLKAEFFNVGRPISSLSQVDFNATPSYTATVENVNFPKTSGVFPQWPGGPSDRFAVRLTGTIFIPET
ncbi:hypothetical protein N9155_00395, partial [bacterium]|nr:hypothetical protein [bacterium]